MSHYDQLSSWYDLLAEGSEGRLRQQALALLSAQPGERVLEIGAGTGCGLVALAEAVGGDGQVWGVDLSKGMLHQSQRCVRKAGIANRVKLVRADGLNLPLSSKSIDAVFLSFTLELFENLQRAELLQEINRVARFGGRLGVVALENGKGGRMVQFYEWTHRRFPKLVDCRPIQVEDELGQNGWQLEITKHYFMWGLPVALALAYKKGEY